MAGPVEEVTGTIEREEVPMLKVVDGLRTADDESSFDIYPRPCSILLIGKEQDMTGFQELLMVLCNINTPSAIICVIQEGNEAGGSFDNITETQISITGPTANTVHLISVDWRNPKRKRFARIYCTKAGGGEAPTICAVGLRMIQFNGNLDTAANVTEVTK